MNKVLKDANIDFLRKIIPYLIVLIVLLIGVAVYFTFFSGKTCNSYECFQREMGACNKAVYLNDEPSATWKYSILGTRGTECVIEVELLQAKQGSLELDGLKGYSMECSYPRGVAKYPDSELERCHGRLKEELQRVIIQRLHIYIIENLGKLDEALNKI